MSSIQIHSQDRDEYADRISLTVDGKTSAYISRDLKPFLGVRRINVLCRNASHKVYRGCGRFFDGFDAAIAGYKSGEMKAAIRTARDQFGA